MGCSDNICRRRTRGNYGIHFSKTLSYKPKWLADKALVLQGVYAVVVDQSVRKRTYSKKILMPSVLSYYPAFIFYFPD